MTGPPPPKGALHPSVVALRHIFCYSDHSLNTPLALEDPNLDAKIPDSLVTGLLFVAVDSDTSSADSYRVLSYEKQHSIGIPVLDMRKMHHDMPLAHHEWHQHAIQSFQFTVG